MAKQAHHRVGYRDMVHRAGLCEEVLGRIKEAALRPDAIKVAPRLNQVQLGSILGLSRNQIYARIKEAKFPAGEHSGNQTYYSLEQVRAMAEAEGIPHEFARGHGITVTISNFKGGVAKTTTTVSLGQYLAARGYRVLVVDLDPQASATTLFGLSPFLDVTAERSAAQLFVGETPDATVLPRPTYWPGLDLIPSSPALYAKEFELAVAAPEYAGEIFYFLRDVLEPLKAAYDVILIDTQPSLGFLPSVANFAADYLLVTVPPSNLDFASSAIFWGQVSDIMSASQQSAAPKYWESVQVLMTRVDSQDKSSSLIRKLMQMGNEDWLQLDPVPATRVATNASSEFKTVYDIDKYEGAAASLKKAREGYDQAYNQVHETLRHIWSVWQNPDDYEVTTMGHELDEYEAEHADVVSDDGVGTQDAEFETVQQSDAS